MSEVAGIGEEQGKVLGPADSEIVPGAVHAGSDQSEAEAEADLASVLLVAAGQSDIFEQLRGNRGKAAEFAVNLGASEHVLAVGGGVRQCGIADAARAVLHGEFAEDERA